MRHAGKVVSKTMIVSHVWDYSFDTGTNAVDVLVYRLRDKIDKGFAPGCCTRFAASGMSSSRNKAAAAPAFARRLGLWYAGLFIVSAVALAIATYVLLARALAAQDHEVLESMLSRYAVEYERTGLPGLQELIQADAGQGRHERLLVRVVNDRTEVVYFAAPPGWGGFDLSLLDAPPLSTSAGHDIGRLPGGAVLEVGTVTLPDGVHVQVGRSSDVRDELLDRFRARGLEVLGLIAVAAVAGGFLLTRAGLAPLRALEAHGPIDSADRRVLRARAGHALARSARRTGRPRQRDAGADRGARRRHARRASTMSRTICERR